MKPSEAIVKKMIVSLTHAAAIQQAALGLVADGGYCDFFVENGSNGKPFHEKCMPSDLTGIESPAERFSGQRMANIQKLADVDGGYCDFFVENGGDGKPFHEKCTTFNIDELVSSPAARASALGRLQVIAAFNKAQLSATGTQG